MLRSLKDLERFTLSATDGDVGSVADFLLDDERWTVRYLVADTGGFFGGRQVLISPISFGSTEWLARRFQVALTKHKIKLSPLVSWDKPVSRQHEVAYHGYFGYPYYWGSSGLWGLGGYPGLLAADARRAALAPPPETTDDVHLRSAKEVRGYHVQGSDHAIGYVDDFIVDDETWAVRYLVIDTSKWWFARKVLLAPHWAQRVDWAERRVVLNLSQQAIRDSPEWNATEAISPAYEASLHGHYGRPAYGSADQAPGARPGAATPR